MIMIKYFIFNFTNLSVTVSLFNYIVSTSILNIIDFLKQLIIFSLFNNIIFTASLSLLKSTETGTI